MINTTATSLIFIFGLVLSWMTCWSFISNYNYLVIFGISLASLVLLKSKLAKYFLILSPLFIFSVLGFCIGTKDYFKGEALFQDFGFLPTENFEDYKNYRIKGTTSGCLVYGVEPMYQKPYNFAVKFLIKSVGFQEGSYVGYFPEKEFCKKEIKTEFKINLAQLESHQIIIESNNEEKINIEKGIYDFWYFQNARGKSVSDNISKQIRTKQISEDCMIAQFNENYIHLIDLKNNRFFHQYELKKQD